MPIRAARHAVSLASQIIVGALYAGLTAMPAEAATYSVISNFNKVVGAQPSGGLTQVGKLLYGSAGLAGPANAGTVFSLKKSGRLAVVTGFSGSGNAVQPLGSLLNINGTLYGVSLEGGGGGVFFSVTPSGTETVLHSFGAGTDGRVPNAGLVYVNGVIYGTTMMGGTYNFGTLYDITLSGEEQVLANFGAASGDASRPSTGLTLLGGTLYGGAEAGARPDMARYIHRISTAMCRLCTHSPI